MKRILAVVLMILVARQSWSRQHKQPVKSSAENDSGYVLALATADRFLHAWSAGDLETGMLLLSDHVRRTHNAETVEQFFAGGQERGFEIMHGGGRAGRYRFPVVLVTRRGKMVRRVVSEIILISGGKNEWAVDRLP